LLRDHATLELGDKQYEACLLFFAMLPPSSFIFVLMQSHFLSKLR